MKKADALPFDTLTPSPAVVDEFLARLDNAAGQKRYFLNAASPIYTATLAQTTRLLAHSDYIVALFFNDKQRERLVDILCEALSPHLRNLHAHERITAFEALVMGIKTAQLDGVARIMPLALHLFNTPEFQQDERLYGRMHKAMMEVFGSDNAALRVASGDYADGYDQILNAMRKKATDNGGRGNPPDELILSWISQAQLALKRKGSGNLRPSGRAETATPTG